MVYEVTRGHVTVTSDIIFQVYCGVLLLC